jgi:reverse gyrase
MTITKLYKRKRFVESLSPDSTFVDDVDDFLKPVKGKRRIRKITIFEESIVDQDKDVTEDPSSERHLSEPELSKLLRYKSKDEGPRRKEKDTIPEWAKLALASSNPNSKRIDYY